MVDTIIDSVRCEFCLKPLARTARMIKRGTRFHKGHCANASRSFTWSEGKLTAHMQKMWKAARLGRRAAVNRRLRSIIGKGGDLALAKRIWDRGYKAGYKAKRYRCASS
jgi:hypothetical protein